MKLYLFSFLVLSSIVLSACDRKGCMDIDADNYNGKAKRDDNSCKFSGNGIVWFDIDKQVQFDNDTIPAVLYYVDSTFVGFQMILDYTGTPPSCNSPKGVTFNYDLGKLKSKLVTLEVREADSTLISTHQFTLQANQCTPFQLPN